MKKKLMLYIESFGLKPSTPLRTQKSLETDAYKFKKKMTKKIRRIILTNEQFV